MDKYQGEDITFNVRLKNKEQRWSDFTRVVLYAYTDKERIVRFSTEERSRYYRLAMAEDGTCLRGVISSAETSLLNGGTLTFEVLTDEQEREADNYITIVKSAVKLKESTIKMEE